ncbi:hypothetical protein ACOME3_002666 [Neoechinorhynchus agilis]
MSEFLPPAPIHKTSMKMVQRRIKVDKVQYSPNFQEDTPTVARSQISNEINIQLPEACAVDFISKNHLEFKRGIIFGGRGVDLTPKIKNNHKRRRQRTVYTKQQLELLNFEFGKNVYVSSATKNRLANIIGVSESQIKVWFQNRRAKEKKLAMASEF